MIGFLRLALSIWVVAEHLSGVKTYAAWAVFGFYILAGYFGSLSFNEKYQKPIPYLWARFKRTAPIYYLVMGLSVFMYLVIGHVPALNKWGLPDIWEWLFIAPSGTTRMIPPAWVLTPMWIGWLLIAVGGCKTRFRAKLGLTMCTVFFVIGAYPRGALWFSPFGVLFPMALGAFLYWQGVRFPRTKGVNLWCERVSYPVFLGHYLIGAIVAHGSGFGLGWPLFWLSLLPTLAFSWVLVKCDQWIKQRHA